MMARRRTHGEEFMQAYMAFDSCGEDLKSGPLHYIIAASAGVRAMAWAESVYWWHSTAARWTWLMEAVGSDGQVKAHYFRVCSKVLHVDDAAAPARCSAGGGTIPYSRFATPLPSCSTHFR
jgi:hypothetical protein